jgi:peptide/nickel transport system substrate-binding protein
MIPKLPGPRTLAAVTAAALLTAGAAACGSSTTPGSSSSSGSARTLVMESSPESTITQAFNPFIATQAIFGMGADGLIYEPLLQFDIAAPPKYYPWLATSYQWSNGGKTVTFTLRQGVKFSNGTPMTPADVAFTYNLVKNNKAINLAGLAISSVSTSGNTVTLTFPTAQYTNLQSIAGVPILPASIWSKAGNPATYADANPVGTGPYKLKTFTPQGFTLTKNSDYWQASLVKVLNVDFPDYTSNTGATNALFAGDIDWTGNFIEGLQADFVAKSPAYHHYWEAPGATNALFLNLSAWPTNQLPVRKAISLAVNRDLIASEGEAGLEDPVLNTTGLTLPTFSAWSGPVASDTTSATGSASAADAVLTAAGYKKNSSGFYALNGKEVTVTLIAPSAYTDYAEVGSIIAGELKTAGINASFNGLTVTAWTADLADGDFSISEHWSTNGLTPYQMYDNWLDSAQASGSARNGDFERVDVPALDADLATLAGASSVTQQTTDLLPLETYVADNVPLIPLTTASEWFEYNSQRFVGWPTQSDPYETGQPSGTDTGAGAGTDEVVLLHLRPRS